MKILQLILLLSISLSATILTLDKDGGGSYTTFSAAHTAASTNGDTILIINGPKNYAMSGETYFKANLCIISQTGRDTFSYTPGGQSMFRSNTNGFRVENMAWRYASKTPSGTSRLFRSTGYGNFFFKNCLFESDTLLAGLQGFELAKNNSNAITNGKITFEECYFHRLSSALASASIQTVGAIADSIYLIRVVLDSAVTHMGSYAYISNCMEIGKIGENAIGDSCHDVTIDGWYLNGLGNTGNVETVTSDDGTNRRYRVVCKNVIFDSGGHGAFFTDYWWDSQIEDVAFLMTVGGSAIYNHNDGAASANDTSGWKLLVKNCYFRSLVNNIIVATNSTDTMWNFVVDSSMIDSGSFSTTLARNDTLRNSIFIQNSPTKTGWDYETGVVTNAGNITLNKKMPFVRYSSTYENYSPYGRLFKITDTSLSPNFSVTCSLSTNFKHHNGILGIDNVFLKNSYYTGDTAKIVWLDSTAGGTWTRFDSLNCVAGNKITLDSAITGTHYFKIAAYGISNGVTTIMDTTSVDSFTIQQTDTECDSIANLGASDSTTTTISVMGRIECLSDSAWIKIATDTNAVTDSTFISISGSSVGDTIIFTKTGLLPSTQYFFQWRDSTYLSLWRSTYTRDSISDTLYDTIVEPITITVQPLPDTVASGDWTFFSCAFSNADSVVGFVNNVRYVKNDTITWYVHPDSNYNGSTVYFVGYNSDGSTSTDTVSLLVWNIEEDSLFTVMKDTFNLGSSMGAAYITNNANKKYNSLLRNNFQSITSAVTMSTVYPLDGVFNFSSMDVLYSEAVTFGKRFVINALIWPQAENSPSWMTALTNEQTQNRLGTFVDTVMRRYPNTYAVEIMNEFTSTSSGIFPFDTANIWVKRVPNVWKFIYDRVRAINNTIRIRVNDYDVENWYSPRTQNYYRFIDTVIASGVILQDISVQAHLKADTGGTYRFDGFGKTVQAARERNCSLIVAELDIRIPNVAGDTAVNIAVQGLMYRAFIDQCIRYGIRDITLWTPTYAISWINGVYPDWNWATLLGNYNAGTGYWNKTAGWYMLKDYFDNRKKIESFKTKHFERKIKVNKACIYDTLDSFTYMIKLPKDSLLYSGKIKNNGLSIGLFDSAGTNNIKRNISEYDKTKRNCIVQVTGSASINYDKWYTLKFGDSSIVYPNYSSALSSNIVTNPDFSSAIEVAGNLRDNDSTVTYDSVLNRAGFARDTCEFGYYMRSGGASGVRNKTTASASLVDTGSITVLLKASPLIASTQRFSTLSQSNVVNYQSVLLGSNSYYGNIMCTTSVARTLYQSFPPFEDTNWHVITATWNRSHATITCDNIKIRDSVGNFRIPFTGTVYQQLFNSLGGTTGANGSISKYYLYNTVKSQPEIFMAHTQILDNAGMFEFSHIDTTIPIINTIIPNQWYGKHAVLSGTKSVEVNGSSVTVPSQTDSTFYFNYQPESTKERFGLKVINGVISDSSTVDWSTSKSKVKIKVK